MPISALADIDVTVESGVNDGAASSWDSGSGVGVVRNGETLSDGSTVFEGLFCVQGTAVSKVTKTIAANVLPKGDYILTADDNGNCSYAVSGDGVSNIKGLKFSYDGTGSIIFTVTRKASGDFSITSLSLAIDIDFADIKAHLEALANGDYTLATALPNLEGAEYDGLKNYGTLNEETWTFNEVKDAPDDKHAYRAAALATADGLAEEIEAINNLLAKLDDSQSDAEKLDLYCNKNKEDMNLSDYLSESWAFKTRILEAIGRIKTHTENVAEQLKLSANWQSNIDRIKLYTFGKLNDDNTIENDGAQLCKNDVDAKTTEDTWVKEQVATAKQEFDDAYNAFIESLPEMKRDDTNDGEDVELYKPFQEALVALRAKATAYISAFDAAVADAAVAGAIDGYIEAIKKEYTTDYNYMMGVTGEYGTSKASELTTLKNTAIEELTKIKNNPAGASEQKITVTAEDGTTTEYTAEAYKGYVVGAMATLKTAVATVVDDAKVLRQEDIEALAALDVKSLKDRIDDLSALNKKANGLSDEAEKIEDAINQASSDIETAFAEYYTKEFIDSEGNKVAANDSIDREIAAIKTAISELTELVATAEAAQADWQKINDQLRDKKDSDPDDFSNYRTSLEAAKSELEKASVKEPVEIDLTAAYKDAYDNVDKAIKDAIEANNALLAEEEGATGVTEAQLNDIAVGVKQYEEKAVPTATEFAAKYDAYKDVAASLTELKKLVTDLDSDSEILEGNTLDKATYTTKIEGYQTTVEGILEAIKNLKDLKGDALYNGIEAVTIPANLKTNIDADFAAFASALIDGNKAALNADAEAYNTKYTTEPETYGPGLKNLKDELAKHQAIIEAGFQVVSTNDGIGVAVTFGGTGLESADANAEKYIVDGTDTGTAVLRATDKTVVNNIYVQYDLACQSANLKLVYTPRKDGANAIPDGLKIMGSDTSDGTYTEIQTLSSVVKNGGSATYEIANANKYQFIRVFPINVNNANTWRIVEMRFITETVEEPTTTDGYLELNGKIVTADKNMKTALKELEDKCKANVDTKKEFDKADSEYSKLSKEISELEAWVKANDGDDADKPAGVFLGTDKYKGLTVSAITEAIDDAYKANGLNETKVGEINGMVTDMKGKVGAFKNRVTGNVDNYQKAMAQYAEIEANINGAVPEVPAVGTEGEDGYVPGTPAQPAVQSIEAWLEENSIDPALSAWKKDTRYTGLSTGLAKIIGDIRAAFEETTVKPETYSDYITDLKTAYNTFKDAVTANEKAHNNQMEQAQKTAENVVRQLNSVVNSKYDESIKFDITTADETTHEGISIKEVADLVKAEQSKLQGINNTVQSDFAQLKSNETKEPTNIDQYIAVDDAVQKIIEQIQGEYSKAVEAANKAMLETATDGKKDALEKAYKEAVNLYNMLTAKKPLSEEEIETEYNAYIDALLDGNTLDDLGHAKLQEHYSVIKNINADAQKILDDATPDLSDDGSLESGKILTVEDFGAITTAVSEALTDINGYIENLKTAVDKFGQGYYEGRLNAANKLVDDAEKDLTAAGLPEEQIADATEDAKLHIATAMAYLDSDPVEGEDNPTVGDMGDVKSKDAEKYINNMTSALHELSLVNVDPLAAMWNYFTNTAQTGVYDKGLARMAEIKGLMEEAEAKTDISWTKFNEAQAVFDGTDDNPALIDKANMYLNDKSLSMSIKAKRVSQIVSQMGKALKKAEEALEDADNAVKANQENIDKLNEFKEQLNGNAEEGINGLVNDLAEMHETIGGLGLSLDGFKAIPTVEADAAVEAVKNALVDENGNDIKNALDKATDIQGKIDAAKRAIDAAYAEAYKQEKAYLESLVESAQEAFNNEYAAGYPEGSGLTEEEWQKQPDEANDAINEAKETIKNLDETGGKAELEQIAELEEGLEALADADAINPDGNGAAREALDGKATDIADDIAEARKGLADLKEALKAIDGTTELSAEGLSEKLSKIKKDYAADKGLATKSGYYDKQLTDLAKEVAALQSSIAAEKSAAQAETQRRADSDTKAEALTSEINTLKEDLQKVVDDINGYEYPTDADTRDYTEVIASINTLIGNAETAVNTAKENYNCTANMTVDATIASSIDNLAQNAAANLAADWKKAAKEAVDAAEADVNGSTHAGQAELDKTLAQLKAELAALDASEDVVADAKEIIQQATELTGDAGESEYLSGDIDGDGEITINDFTRLVDMVIGRMSKPETGTPAFATADLNNDGKILVGDAVKLLQIINNIDDVSTARKVARSRAMSVENAASLDNGQLRITNNVSVAAVLVDLQGVSAYDVTLAARAAGMNVITNKLEDGTLRVMIIGMDGNTLEGNSGTVLNINGKAKILSAYIADAMGNDYQLAGDSDATIIDTIKEGFKAAGRKVYNMGGQLVDGVKRGINIIRNADGTTNKVMKK